MEIKFSTECEAKFITDKAGLDSVSKWVDRKVPSNLGKLSSVRRHLYYDQPDLLLAKRDFVFRRALNKPAYCFKYPVSREGSFVIRREIFTKCEGFDLNIRNPLHSQLPVFRWLQVHLGYDVPPARHLSEFEPRVRLEISRTYRAMPHDSDPNWSVIVALDEVDAFLIGQDKAFHSWCEVEIEATIDFDDSRKAALLLTEELQTEGMEECFTSKYAVAAQFLPKETRGYR